MQSDARGPDNTKLDAFERLPNLMSVVENGAGIREDLDEVMDCGRVPGRLV